MIDAAHALGAPARAVLTEARSLHANMTAGPADFPALLREAGLGVEKAEAIREGAVALVSAAFILPVLEELRASSMAAPPFAPGFAEKRFGPMLDQHTADRIVRSGRFPLVDVLVDRLTPAGNDAREADDGQS